MVGLPYESAITSITGLVSEWIEDPDKKIEFEFKMRELNIRLAEAQLKTQTIPWVDALIKVMYASIAFARPIGAGLMTCFGLYAHVKGIDIDPTIHGMIDMTLPA